VSVGAADSLDKSLHTFLIRSGWCRDAGLNSASGHLILAPLEVLKPGTEASRDVAWNVNGVAAEA
jgi:hypothetical protein